MIRINSMISILFRLQRNFLIGALALAVAATLVVVVPQATRTAGASVEDLPSDTGLLVLRKGVVASRIK